MIYPQHYGRERRRKPRYKWFESHRAWLLQSAVGGDWPLWLFPPGA